MTALALYTLTVYAVTFVVTSSSLFEPFRLWLTQKAPRLKIGSGKHPIECRMCFGFWVSVLVCNFDYKLILPVYGLSYFMATQER